MTVSTPGPGPQNRSLPSPSGLSASRSSRLLAVGRCQGSRFLDVDFKNPVFIDGEPLALLILPLTTIKSFKNRSKRIRERLDWNPTFLYVVEPFTVYEATELVNLINQDVPSLATSRKIRRIRREEASSGYLKNHARPIAQNSRSRRVHSTSPPLTLVTEGQFSCSALLCKVV